MSGAVFTIGTEEKMDMDLDSIIDRKKNNRINQSKMGTRMRGTTTRTTQRRQTIAQNASRRAANRVGRVSKIRGVQNTNTTAQSNKQNGKSSLRVSVGNGTGHSSNWLAQQAVRNQQARKKMQLYKETAKSNSQKNQPNNTPSEKSNITITVPNTGFRFDAPPSYQERNTNNTGTTFTIGSQDRSNRDRGQRRGQNRRPQGETRKTRVTERATPTPQERDDVRRVSFKNRQANDVAQRRGMQTSGSSINEIFGNVEPQSNSNRGNNRNRGGNRGGRGNRGARGNRGGRRVNIVN